MSIWVVFDTLRQNEVIRRLLLQNVDGKLMKPNHKYGVDYPYTIIVNLIILKEINTLLHSKVYYSQIINVTFKLEIYQLPSCILNL